VKKKVCMSATNARKKKKIFKGKTIAEPFAQEKFGSGACPGKKKEKGRNLTMG